MSETRKGISVGDMVVVVRVDFCCADANYLGNIFKVADISMQHGPCLSCGDRSEVLCALHAKERTYHDLRTLRKIDPSSLDESTEHKEELTA